MQILKETIINAETKNPNLFTSINPLPLLSNSNLPLQIKSAYLYTNENDFTFQVVYK
ncbi:MAG: hypothetical protein IPG24_17990 [Leptospiraceae bacterium]|nr:hypothetical protein [Leptospiraceae bacterium]